MECQPGSICRRASQFSGIDLNVAPSEAECEDLEWQPQPASWLSRIDLNVAPHEAEHEDLEWHPGYISQPASQRLGMQTSSICQPASQFSLLQDEA